MSGKRAKAARRNPSRNGANGSGKARVTSESPGGNSGWAWWPNVFEGADRSDFRGYFYFPQLSPADQMNSMTRRAIQERVDFLCNNVGAVAMVHDGLATDEIGGVGLWPKWVTGEKDYDKFMTDSFHYTNHDPRFFSADAMHSYYGVQYAIRRGIRRYGDLGGQLLRPSQGFTMPLMHLVPGYLIDNNGKEKPQEGWTDGTKSDKFGRITDFRLLEKENGDKSHDVPALDLLHFHDEFLPGQRRGMPALYSVVKKMFKREDITRAMANGVLARERMGFAIETDAGGIGGPTFSMPGAEKAETVKNKDGSSYTLLKFFGADGVENVAVPILSRGAKLRTVESNRPASQEMDLLDSILRELAWATSRPPEYIFFLGDMGQGTVARLVMYRVRVLNIRARENQLIPQFCNRYNVFWAWQKIISGSIPKDVKVPDNWWKHKIIPPADQTVDVGREGNLYDERVETNKMPIEEYYGMGGWDRGDVDDSNFAVMQDRLERLAEFNTKNGTEFTYFDIWPRGSNQGFARLPQNIADAVTQNANENPPKKK